MHKSPGRNLPDLTAELVETSPAQSQEGNSPIGEGKRESIEDYVDMTLAVIHKTYFQSLSIQRTLGDDCFPSNFMTFPLLSKTQLLERLTSRLCSLLLTLPSPTSQSFQFSHPSEHQNIALAVSSVHLEPEPPLLNRILDMPEREIVLKPEETKQLAAIIFGAIRDSSSEVYRKQATEMQEQMMHMGEELLRCRQKLRDREESILSLEQKLAEKPKPSPS